VDAHDLDAFLAERDADLDLRRSIEPGLEGTATVLFRHRWVQAACSAAKGGSGSLLQERDREQLAVHRPVALERTLVGLGHAC
jgi:hypothetical protein